MVKDRDFLTRCGTQVKARTLWGSGLYTHDSDLVAVLMHCGYVNSIAGIPQSSVAEAHVMLEYLPPSKFYPSVFRNGVRSRAWGHSEHGCSFRVSKLSESSSRALVSGAELACPAGRHTHPEGANWEVPRCH